jgi:hypothetical protein
MQRKSTVITSFKVTQNEVYLMGGAISRVAIWWRHITRGYNQKGGAISHVAATKRVAPYHMFCLWLPHVLVVTATCSGCDYHMFCLWLPHVLVVTATCSGCDYYMFWLWLPHVLVVTDTCSGCDWHVFCLWLPHVLLVTTKCYACGQLNYDLQFVVPLCGNRKYYRYLQRNNTEVHSFSPVLAQTYWHRYVFYTNQDKIISWSHKNLPFKCSSQP